MFDPLVDVSWSAGLLWLAGISVAAFLVSWSLSEVRPTTRASYIPVLALVTGSLTAGYVVWSEVGASFWTNRWAYGLAGAVVAGGLLTALLTRLHIPHTEPHAISARAIASDGLVYGAAEGLLLSVLPVVVTWQMLSSNGWATGWRIVTAGALSIVVSIVVIVIHHLGYPDFRGRKMGQAVLGCGILSLAYLLTASVIAPVLAHAVLHTVMVRKGMELPPHEPVTESVTREPMAA